MASGTSRLTRVLIGCVALALTTAAKDDRTERAFTVVNDTSAAVNQLFVRPVTAKRGVSDKVRALLKRDAATDRDRLGLQSLRQGGSIALTLTSQRCAYDLSAVLEDGRTYRSDNFDVCTNGRWLITTGTLD